MANAESAKHLRLGRYAKPYSRPSRCRRIARQTVWQAKLAVRHVPATCCKLGSGKFAPQRKQHSNISFGVLRISQSRTAKSRSTLMQGDSEPTKQFRGTQTKRCSCTSKGIKYKTYEVFAYRHVHVYTRYDSTCVDCGYVCIRTYVCMYACMCMYVCMYVRMNVCTVRMYVRMYVCMYVYVYVCMYVCMCVCMYVYVCNVM